MTATTHEDLHSPQLQQDASEQHKPTSPWMWIALIVAIRSHRPGEEVDLLLTRDDEELTLSVTLGSEVG